jgi:hypothetical protein
MMRLISIFFALTMLTLMDVSQVTQFKFGMVRDAEALIGIPFSPLSVAGVARRTTRRAVVMSSAEASAAAQTSASTDAQTTQSSAPVSTTKPAKGAVPLGTIITTLPDGCVTEAKAGVQYYKCSKTYYRVAFQGDKLVYVAAQP